jgi:hypothetical protein
VADKAKHRNEMKPRQLLPALGFLLIAYPLSIGPAAWISYRHYSPPEPPAFTTFYTPLAAACKQIPWLDDAMERYISLWVPGITH